MGSYRRIGGGIQIPETQFQAFLPFPALPPERPGELARRPRVGNNIIQDLPLIDFFTTTITSVFIVVSPKSSYQHHFSSNNINAQISKEKVTRSSKMIT